MQGKQNSQSGRGGGQGRGNGERGSYNNHNNNNNNNNSSSGGKTGVYNEYLPADVVQKGLLDGTLYQGLLRVNPKRRKVAYVTCEGIKIDVFIEDEKLRNRAIHGDVVVVELLPQSEWLPIVQRSQTTEAVNLTVGQSGAAWTESSVAVDEDDDEDEHHLQVLWQPRAELLVSRPENDQSTTETPLHPIDIISQQSGLQPKARVVHILKNSHTVLHVGAIAANCPLQPGKPFPETENYVFFKPADARYPHCILPRMQLPNAYREDPFQQQKNIYLAEIASPWTSTSRLPMAMNVRSVGETGTIQAETEALLIQNEINHGYFTEEQLQPLREMLAQQNVLINADTVPDSSTNPPITNNSELEKVVPWVIPEEEIAKRRDLRSYRIFTIDPPNAKDLDDALHITLLDNGTYEIGVHIADVSYFLQEGTLLDTEAQKRATSIYLVQKVIPMLPPILCEQLCSLNPNVDRLAFSCIWKMNADGTLVAGDEPYFGRTVIRSCAKLDYPTAQRMVDGLIPNKFPPHGSGSGGSDDDEDAFLKNVPEEVWESRRRPVGQSGLSPLCNLSNLSLSPLSRISLPPLSRLSELLHPTHNILNTTLNSTFM